MSKIRKAGDYEIRHSMQIGDTEVVIGVNMKAPDKMYYMVADYENNGIVARYYNALVSDDYIEITGIYADRIKAEIERLKDVEKDAPKSLITSDMCETITDRDLENEIIVIMPQVLRPEYRTQTHQILLCTGGNGARPDTLGSAIFGEKMYYGKNTRYERVDVLGVLKKEHYPEWLITKLEYKEALKNPAVFEYGDKHFLPVGTINKKTPLHKEAHNLKTDTDMGYWHKKYENVYGKAKNDYTHKGFYDACKNIPCDIFKCVENGRFYIPAEYELFEYTGNFEPYTEQENTSPKNTKKKSHKEVER